MSEPEFSPEDVLTLEFVLEILPPRTPPAVSEAVRSIADRIAAKLPDNTVQFPTKPQD